MIDDRDNGAAACFDFLQIAQHFVVHDTTRNDEDRRRMFIDQGDRAMFHFSGRIAFGMDIADLFQLEGAFES